MAPRILPSRVLDFVLIIAGSSRAFPTGCLTVRFVRPLFGWTARHAGAAWQIEESGDFAIDEHLDDQHQKDDIYVTDREERCAPQEKVVTAVLAGASSSH